MSFLNVHECYISDAAAEGSAKALRSAMKGIGTDESALIKEILKHSSSQRQVIKDKFKTLYGKNLVDEIESETSGNFKRGLIALLDPSDVYEAKCVRQAIKGIGTDEKVLIEILCPKDAHEIAHLKTVYQNVFHRDLAKDVDGDVSGDFGRLLKSIVGAGRSTSTAIDRDLAAKEAQELYKAGEGRLGTDESKFVRILGSRSFPQLAATFDAYATISKNDVEKAIKSEMSGHLEAACLAVVRAARSKNAFVAHELRNAMAGFGTDDTALIRLLVSYAERNMEGIKSEYKKLYGKSLYDAVKSDISGDYEKLFLGLIGH